ncbi:hypothetical protein NC653_028905 [Populus alba x Populus x berolinensis]|uniref:Uncharacterized protein n=1 Tax=Populus alba x Populus x berolinensis TaxID=444605 RepID=A0AAD6M121_9ROSI|nr:hypothetical protein NC653_028905 [Populus alba x Populus x berolinensis]
MHSYFGTSSLMTLSSLSANRKPRQHHNRKWFHIRRGSSDEKEIEHYLKFSNSDVKDIESSLDPTTSSSLSFK